MVRSIALWTHSATAGSSRSPLLKKPWSHGDSNSSKNVCQWKRMLHYDEILCMMYHWIIDDYAILDHHDVDDEVDVDRFNNHACQSARSDVDWRVRGVPKRLNIVSNMTARYWWWCDERWDWGASLPVGLRSACRPQSHPLRVIPSTLKSPVLYKSVIFFIKGPSVYYVITFAPPLHVICNHLDLSP